MNNDTQNQYPQPNQSPITPAAAPEAAPPPQQPYRQSQVSYLPGPTVFTKVPSILEWGVDGRIRLWGYYANQASPTLFFDCIPQEIKKFAPAVGTVNIVLLNGPRFTVEFSAQGRNMSVASGIMNSFGMVGMVAGTLMQRSAAQRPGEDDLEWWKENLNRFGVGGMNMGTKQMYNFTKILMIGVAVFVAVLLVFWLIVALAASL